MLEITFYVLLDLMRIVFLYCLVCLILSITRLRRLKVLRRIFIKWYLSIILWIVVVLCAFQMRLSYSKFIELNPQVQEEELIGKWEKSDFSLQLNPDNSFRIVEKHFLQKSETFSGDWTLSNNLISLERKNGRVDVFQAILFDNNIRIIEKLADGDGCVNDFGLKRDNGN